MPKVRMLACDSSHAVGTKPSKSLEPIVGSQRIDPETEFVILASTGIWEVNNIISNVPLQITIKMELV